MILILSMCKLNCCRMSVPVNHNIMSCGLFTKLYMRDMVSTGTVSDMSLWS